MTQQAKQHGKEIKIGLAVLGALLITLGVVLVKRWSSSGDAPTATINGASDTPLTSSTVAQHGPPSQPTTLQSQPYSTKATYVEPAEPPVAAWKAPAASRAAENEPEIPPRSLSPKSPTYNDQTGQIPPQTNFDLTDSENSSTGAPDDLTATPDGASTTTLKPSLPPYEQSQQAIQEAAARYAMRPAQQTETSQRQSLQDLQYERQHGAVPAYDQPNDDQYGLSQQAAEQRDLYVDQDATPSQYTTPAGGQSAVQQQQIPTYQQQAPLYQQQPTSLPVDARLASSTDTSPIVKGKAFVQPGETLWALSRRVYGSGAFFKALAEHNSQRLPNPHNLRIGDEVLTPDLAVLRRRYPGLCPRERKRQPGTPAANMVSVSTVRGGRSYLVEKGDTLFDIARYELGAGARWPEIFQLNRRALGEDFDYLKPGTKLVLPARDSSPRQQQDQDAVAERPTDRYQR